MYPYLPHTDEDIIKMLEIIGVSDLQELFKDIPEDILLNRELSLESSKSEVEVINEVKKAANLNKTVEEAISFLGGGAYEHYIPSIIKHLVSRQEFLTAYTPYQPELSQGTLQAIFEYQTMICELTGMDVSNASLYDGGTALAEAVFMANHGNKKKEVLISKTVNPEYRNVVETYSRFNGLKYIEIDEVDGLTDVEDLKKKYSAETTAVIVQVPNYFGLVEDMTALHSVLDSVKTKAQFIVSADPISLSVLEAPREYGADIVVGEGQTLGNSLQFGGPYLGFMATTKANMRRMPGRIVGQTLDKDGKRGFVLTLQAREQHIRREKAMSNITSNEGLNALMATIYIAAMGHKGLREVSIQSVSKAHYFADCITTIDGLALKYKQPFMNEFVITCNKNAYELNEKMLENNIFIGHVLNEHDILTAVTEVHPKVDLDEAVRTLEVCYEAI